MLPVVRGIQTVLFSLETGNTILCGCRFEIGMCVGTFFENSEENSENIFFSLLVLVVVNESS